jgi:DinB family protein
VADLTDAQLGARPTPTAHSIGWTLWHIARADDNFQRELTGRSISKDGGYGARWGHSDRMNEMEDSAAAAIAIPAKAELLGYVRAVFVATDAAVATIDDARFSEEIQSGSMSGHCAVGAAYVASIGHDGRHLGEMEYIKGLQGIPGTVTV